MGREPPPALTLLPQTMPLSRRLQKEKVEEPKKASKELAQVFARSFIQPRKKPLSGQQAVRAKRLEALCWKDVTVHARLRPRPRASARACTRARSHARGAGRAEGVLLAPCASLGERWSGAVGAHSTCCEACSSVLGRCGWRARVPKTPVCVGRCTLPALSAAPVLWELRRPIFAWGAPPPAVCPPGGDKGNHVPSPKVRGLRTGPSSRLPCSIPPCPAY